MQFLSISSFIIKSQEKLIPLLHYFYFIITSMIVAKTSSINMSYYAFTSQSIFAFKIFLILNIIKSLLYISISFNELSFQV